MLLLLRLTELTVLHFQTLTHLLIAGSIQYEIMSSDFLAPLHFTSLHFTSLFVCIYLFVLRSVKKEPRCGASEKRFITGSLDFVFKLNNTISVHFHDITCFICIRSAMVIQC